MTNCKSCSNFQPRLKKGGLCDGCSERRSSQPSTNGMNSYFEASAFNLNNVGNTSESLRGPNVPFSQQLPPQQQLGIQPLHVSSPANFNQFPPQNNSFRMQQPIRPQMPQPPPSSITPESINNLMDKSISELTVADIIQINQISNGPIRQQLNSMENEFNKKFQQMQNKMEILDNEKSKLQDENSVLRQTVMNIQKSLNKIDSEVRNKNVIITGLPEEEIQEPDRNAVLKSDKEKIQWLLKKMENESFNDRMENMEVSRMGTARAGYNRVVKIVLPSMEDRNEFLKNTVKMKDTPEPWKKVYIKKDQHPVYIAETNRLRKKAADLRKRPGYEEKEVKVYNGKLTVDNDEVDRNLFFQ